MAARLATLVDTNILVYTVDPDEVAKGHTAATLMRDGARAGSLKLAHQVVVEFVSVVTRSRRGATPLLTVPAAVRAATRLLESYEVLYPTLAVVELALSGITQYQLSWYDARLWAYAEHFSLDTLYSEDFQHGRKYGGVRVINPFA